MKHLNNTTIGLGVVVITLIAGVFGPYALGLEVLGLWLMVLLGHHRGPRDD